MKIISILTIFLIVLYILTPITFAKSLGGQQISVDFSGAPSEMVDMGNSIIGVIQVVGIIIAVVIIIVLGIKYMLGSADEKAASKKSMMPYLVGAICVFATTVIIGTAANWVDSRITTTSSSGDHGTTGDPVIRYYAEPAQIIISEEQAHETEWWTNKENIQQLLLDNSVKIFAEHESGNITQINNWIVIGVQTSPQDNKIKAKALIGTKVLGIVNMYWPACFVDIEGYLSD